MYEGAVPASVSARQGGGGVGAARALHGDFAVECNLDSVFCPGIKRSADNGKKAKACAV